MEKVLLVDDEPDIIHQLKRIIRKEGFEVLTAADGQAGLELFQKELPGLVITDVAMPGMNGIELLRRIKKLSPRTEVIVVTGHGDYDTAIQVLREEALDYLKKPVDLERLLIALGRYQERAGSLEEFLRPSVLLLDDDEDARHSMVRYLKKEGYDVFSGEDGEEGLRILDEKRIDIVITDIMMPKMDGLQFLKQVKKRPGDIEVILITGFGNEDVVVQAMHDGANNFLRKPVDIEHMLIAVEKAFEKVTLKRSLARKSRDLELTQNIMAKLTEHGDIVIDLRELGEVQGHDIGQKLFDLAILPIVTVNSELQCVYANKHFRNIFKDDLVNISDRWEAELPRIGIHGFSYDQFRNRVLSLYESSDNTVESIKLTEFSYIVFSKITVMLIDRNMHLVAAIFRGERK